MNESAASRAAAVSPDDWESHWSQYGDSNALNPAQVYRRRLIEQALALDRASRPVRLVELGCGHGDLARELTRAHPHVEFLGIDGAAAAIAIAQRKVPAGAFVQADLTRPEQLSEQYRRFASHAVCSEVLEHVDDPVAVLRGARALLEPGCRLVITVPAGPVSAFDRHIGHRKHFTRTELSGLLSAAGLEPMQVDGAGFPFFNAYRLAVVARGERLIQDAGPDTSARLPLSARAAIWAFSTLFRFNRDHGRRGWQLLAVAREPGGVP